MSVIILDGKTMVEVNNVLMELEEAVDFVVHRARSYCLPLTRGVIHPERDGSHAGRERNGNS